MVPPRALTLAARFGRAVRLEQIEKDLTLRGVEVS